MQCTGNSGCFPQWKRAAIVRHYPVFSCVQCFCVTVIHRTLTWTTGSLTCIRSNACVYTQGWGTPTTSQHNILTQKTLTNLSFALDGIWTSGHGIHWISRPTLYQLSHHVISADKQLHMRNFPRLLQKPLHCNRITLMNYAVGHLGWSAQNTGLTVQRTRKTVWIMTSRSDTHLQHRLD